jgi:hypothetical protein
MKLGAYTSLVVSAASEAVEGDGKAVEAGEDAAPAAFAAALLLQLMLQLLQQQ